MEEIGVKYINNIRKSSEDKRLYKGLILPNQLRVLLISDPETEKSAASLSVGVGHLSNPDDLPGLAHFCEHMLFLGSEKYPDESEYRKYLVEHGGSYNAYTSADQTLYHFDVASEHLKGILDRFAQFFLCPLMAESAVEREVNAVNSEHEKNLADDVWRFEQLRRSSSDNGHPFRKFGTGNKKTLAVLPQEKGIDVREELLNFHGKWYSANIMTLVVLGKECLEDLEEMVVPLFAEVVNKNVERPTWTDHPYGPDQIGTKTYVVPIKDLKELRIYFPIPDLREYYKARPAEYIADLAGHEGPGSLLSALKSKGWANTFDAGSEKSARKFGFFTLSSDLTDDGIEKIDEIITLIFQYFKMVREFGVQEWFFKESQKIMELDFRFKGKMDAVDYVVQIAENDRDYDYPVEEMLIGRHLLEEWRPDLIVNLLTDYLIPSNIKMFVVGQKFEEIAEETEPWYGTKYKVEKIPEDVIQKWENCGLNSELKLPVPNEFIPSNFEIFYKVGQKGLPRHPLIIRENPFLRVWLKQDDEFLLPKANLKLQIISPLAYLDPLSQNLTCIFVDLLKDALNEYTYYASLAGLMYDISSNDYGLDLTLYGFNDKQNVFLDKILEKMTNFNVNPQRFDMEKEDYIRSLRNFEGYEPHDRIYYYLCWLVREKAWRTEELLQTAEQMTTELLENFILQFLSKFYVQCLIHGNVDEKIADSFVEVIERRLTPKLPLMPQELLRFREVKLNDGEYCLQEIPDRLHKNFCIEIYYQCCSLSTENNILMQLLNQTLEEPYFDFLRTKEQLGYAIFCSCWKSDSVQGLTIIVQSEKHPNFLDQRIEAFLAHMRELLEDMSEEEFERNKDALAVNRLEKAKNLTELTGEFWAEIFSQQYNFNRDEIEVAYLRTVTKTDLIKFFDDYIKVGAPKRRKLSIHIIPAGISSEADVEPTKIENIIKFKKSHDLYALTDAFVDISTLKYK